MQGLRSRNAGRTVPCLGLVPHRPKSRCSRSRSMSSPAPATSFRSLVSGFQQQDRRRQEITAGQRGVADLLEQLIRRFRIRGSLRWSRSTRRTYARCWSPESSKPRSDCQGDQGARRMPKRALSMKVNESLFAHKNNATLNCCAAHAEAPRHPESSLRSGSTSPHARGEVTAAGEMDGSSAPCYPRETLHDSLAANNVRPSLEPARSDSPVSSLPGKRAPHPQPARGGRFAVRRAERTDARGRARSGRRHALSARC